MHRVTDFAGAFDIARDAGLGITIHAGEMAGAFSVRDALDHVRPSRISHGVRDGRTWSSASRTLKAPAISPAWMVMPSPASRAMSKAPAKSATRCMRSSPAKLKPVTSG